MILSIYIIFGTYVSDAHKSMDSQREPKSLTDGPFRDCSALAMLQFWCGDGSSPSKGQTGKAFLMAYGWS